MAIRNRTDLEHAVRHSLFDTQVKLEIIEYVWGERPAWNLDLLVDPNYLELERNVDNFTQARLQDIMRYGYETYDYDRLLVADLESRRQLREQEAPAELTAA